MKPAYIIIRGPLASGKSTISGKLAEQTKGEHIAYDRILDEFKLTKDKEEGYISQKSFFRANEIAAERAEKIIEKGKLEVFDGNFYWKSQIENLIKKLPYEHEVFTLKTSVETCIARDEERASVEMRTGIGDEITNVCRESALLIAAELVRLDGHLIANIESKLYGFVFRKINKFVFILNLYGKNYC